MRWPATFVLVLALSFLAGCERGDTLTCVEHHSAPFITGWVNQLEPTSTGRLVKVERPVMATTDVCDRWEVAKEER